MAPFLAETEISLWRLEKEQDPDAYDKTKERDGYFLFPTPFCLEHKTLHLAFEISGSGAGVQGRLEMSRGGTRWLALALLGHLLTPCLHGNLSVFPGCPAPLFCFPSLYLQSSSRFREAPILSILLYNAKWLRGKIQSPTSPRSPRPTRAKPGETGLALISVTLYLRWMQLSSYERNDATHLP